MKKKLGIGIIALTMVGGALAFANNNFTTKSNTVCPSRPGCICPEKTEKTCNLKSTGCDEAGCTDESECTVSK